MKNPKIKIISMDEHLVVYDITFECLKCGRKFKSEEECENCDHDKSDKFTKIDL